MRCFLSLGAAMMAFCSATIASAHIGASEAYLVARFGAVQARLPERILEQGRIFVLGERVVLKQREWRVTAVLIDGRCAKITYAKSGPWTELHYRDLLGENTGDWTWGEIVGGAPKWQRTWRRSDGLVAKWMYAGGFAIEGQSFVDAREEARATVQRAPATTASR